MEKHRSTSPPEPAGGAAGDCVPIETGFADPHALIQLLWVIVRKNVLGANALLIRLLDLGLTPRSSD
jgi:hypothetical protein